MCFLFCFFFTFLVKETNLSKLRFCHLKCGKSWNWYRADLVPLSSPIKGGGGEGENDTNITTNLEGSSEMLINFKFPKESCVFLWVSTTVKRNIAKSLKQEKNELLINPSFRNSLRYSVRKTKGHSAFIPHSSCKYGGCRCQNQNGTVAPRAQQPTLSETCPVISLCFLKFQILTTCPFKWKR